MSPLRTLLLATRRLPAAATAPTAAAAAPRLYHATPASSQPYKDDQDRTSLKPRSTQGSQSGTDDAAAQMDVAFDPAKTSPEEQKKAAKRETKKSGEDESKSPLNVSGAVHEASKPLGEDGGPEMKEATRGGKEGQK